MKRFGEVKTDTPLVCGDWVRNEVRIMMSKYVCFDWLAQLLRNSTTSSLEPHR